MVEVNTLLEQNKAIFWDISNLHKLDRLAIEERFFQYGNWQNIQDMIEIYGMENLKADYRVLRIKKRSPLSKKTLHFFDLYFHVS